MGLVQGAGERDGETVLAHYVGMAEALQEEPLIVAEMPVVVVIIMIWIGREVFEGADALRGKPVERGFRLDGPQHEIAARACQRQLSLIHISEPTRRTPISYAVF